MQRSGPRGFSKGGADEIEKDLWDTRPGESRKSPRKTSKRLRKMSPSFRLRISAYNGLDCAKQRCLVHLLRELAKLREELPWQSVRAFIQPLIDLFRDAIQLGKDREELGPAEFHTGYRRIIDRFDELMLETRSRHPDCVRIWKRLYKHCDELFTFLDDPAVPAGHNGTEGDIRSLAAARNDGGTNRADWSAAAFARLKSVIVTGMKNHVRFIRYGIEVVRAKLRGEHLPLPLAATPDTG